jgi:hypothetical protein
LYELRGFNFCEKQEDPKTQFLFLLICIYYYTSSVDAVTMKFWRFVSSTGVESVLSRHELQQNIYM